MKRAREAGCARRELGGLSRFIKRENEEKCILIACGGGGEVRKRVYLEAGEEKKMGGIGGRQTRTGRVHQGSAVAGFDQLLTPCRLAAVPTNDAMMAVSNPPPPPQPPISPPSCVPLPPTSGNNRVGENK